MNATCWNCGESASGRFCPRCKALRPPVHDYFEFFELPRNLALDAKELEKRFYALSRQLHPDHYSRKDPREREYSLHATAVLNDAHRTLRDPIARAQYLLKIEGFDIGEQGAKDVPPELLEEVFELNMALEEDAQPELEAARRKFEGMRDEIDSTIEKEFAEWDRGRDRETLASIRGLLNRRKYITNLIGKTNHVSDRV
jgi:molecular chaperone HscB